MERRTRKTFTVAGGGIQSEVSSATSLPASIVTAGAPPSAENSALQITLEKRNGKNYFQFLGWSGWSFEGEERLVRMMEARLKLLKLI